MGLTIAEIAARIGAGAVGDTALRPARLRQPDEAGADDLALAMEPAFRDRLRDGSARMAVLSADSDWQGLGLDAAILVERPRYAMALLSRLFDRRIRVEGVHPAAHVDPTAELGEGVAVGPGAVIEAGARIGARTEIGPQVFVGANAVIGADGWLAAGCRIGSDVRIGDRFVGQMNAVIGGDGFSFVTAQPSAVEEYLRDGSTETAMRPDRHERINSLGAVVVGDDVEVGANSVIDKGTVADTRIGDGTKIDALVMVAHNVQVGRTALLCGQAGIAGSTLIGDRVVLAGQVGVVDHISIGEDTIVLSGSKVQTRAPARSVLSGHPAVKQATFMQMYKSLRRLPLLAEKVEALQKRVSKADDND